MRLAGKSAIVTGAGSGMGRAMAERFAREGAHVLCADRNGSEEAVAHAIGAAAVPWHADVAVEHDVAAMVAAAIDAFGRVDILVNNAGFGGRMAPLHEQTEEEWDRVHSVNLKGVFFGIKHGVAAMLAGGGGGAILNIGSATGLVGWRHHGVYAAAKAGVGQLTKCAALDYAAANIRVNAIMPGTIWTGLVPMAKEHAAPPPDAFRIPGIPMDRWGLASEVADAALFLVSDEASYVTGTLLPVDGGYAIGYSGMAADQSAS